MSTIVRLCWHSTCFSSRHYSCQSCPLIIVLPAPKLVIVSPLPPTDVIRLCFSFVIQRSLRIHAHCFRRKSHSTVSPTSFVWFQGLCDRPTREFVSITQFWTCNRKRKKKSLWSITSGTQKQKLATALTLNFGAKPSAADFFFFCETRWYELLYAFEMNGSFFISTQGQGNHFMVHLERGIERENARRFSSKGRERAVVSQTRHWNWDGVKRVWAFPSA